MAFDLVRRAPYVRQVQSLDTRLAAAQRPALLASARIHAAALVARSALVNIELLTDLEVEVVKRHGALVDVRAHAVVDTFTGLCVAELSRLGLGG